MKVTLLGCGGSSGVPLAGDEVGGNWGACDPTDPRNRRTRTSALVEVDGQKILIDAGPDLRQQMLDNQVTSLDAVLLTHAHADHCHGLDELRGMRFVMGAPIPCYMDGVTRKEVTMKFDYAFTSSHSQDKLYPALLEDREIDYGAFDLNGIKVLAFKQHHGNINSTGFRIGNFAYSTDVVELDEVAFEALQGLDLWVVDALRFDPHPTHAHFDLTMSWIERVKPKQAVLIHLNHMMNYQTVLERCPKSVQPGHDGLVIEIED